MKIKLTFLLIFLTVSIIAQKPVTIHLELQNIPAQTASIETFNKSDFQKQNIQFIDNKVNISLETHQLEFLRLAFNQNIFIVIIALPGEKITIQADMTDLFSTIDVKGSPHTILVYKMQKEEATYQMKVDSIIQYYNQLPEVEKTQENAAYYQQKIDQTNKLKEQAIIAFVKANSSSPSCLFFIEQLNISEHIQLYTDVSEKLQASYKDHPIISSFTTKVDNEKKTGIGVVSPDIQLPGISGDTISLYPLQGKVTIIDFWASWCGPCRKENPHKVAMYEKYKEKGLVMYSVSLDQNEAGWKNAIISDKLGWPAHVSELKGWQSVTSRSFGVGSIPANVILDKDGKIIAKNIRGEQLEALIHTMLGQ